MSIKWFVTGVLCGGTIGLVASNMFQSWKNRFESRIRYWAFVEKEKSDKEKQAQNKSTDTIAWTIDPRHEWIRMDRDLQSAVPLSIQFDQAGVDKDYRLKAIEGEAPDLTVPEIALWFCSLLHRRQTVTENSARNLHSIIAEKQNEWGVEGIEFAFDTLYSVSIRTNRPVQLAWTVHFSDAAGSSDETMVELLERKVLENETRWQEDEPTDNVNIAAGNDRLSERQTSVRFIDLYVTATDAEHYGPGYGRFVVRIFYTMPKMSLEKNPD